MSDEHATPRLMMSRVDRVPSSRRRTAACLAACLLAACTLGAPGCTVCQHARRTLIQEPLEFSAKGDRARSLKAYRQWADEAWAVERQACPEVASDPDYALGFRDGFVDYIYAGGDGQPPPIPPRKFWNVGWRTPGGDVGAQQWFAGFRHGAQSARNSGLRQNGVVLSSYLAFGQMEGPSFEGDSQPPSLYGESLSDPQEPLPAPNGGVVPPTPRGPGGSALPRDGGSLYSPPGVDGPGALQPQTDGAGADPQTSDRTGSSTTALYTGIVPPTRSASPGAAPFVPFEPIQPVELPATDGFDVANAVQQALGGDGGPTSGGVQQATGETTIPENSTAPTPSSNAAMTEASTSVAAPAAPLAMPPARDVAAANPIASPVITTASGLSGGPTVPAEPIAGEIGGAAAGAPPTNPVVPAATSDAAERFRRAVVPEQDGAAAFPVDRPLVIEPSVDGSATSATQRFRRAVSPFRSPEPSTTH